MHAAHPCLPSFVRPWHYRTFSAWLFTGWVISAHLSRAQGRLFAGCTSPPWVGNYDRIPPLARPLTVLENRLQGNAGAQPL
jgi:hypothetical protein